LIFPRPDPFTEGNRFRDGDGKKARKKETKYGGRWEKEKKREPNTEKPDKKTKRER
jgi:hypothetical protein